MKLFARRACLLIFLLLSLTLVIPAYAAPPTRRDDDRCVHQKNIENWKSLDQIERDGFHVDLVGPQASLTFGREQQRKFMSLDIASNPSSSAYTASRVTEIQSQLPIDQRVKCWQTTPTTNIVAVYEVRFDQAAAPTDLTENLIFWNAPLPSQGSTEPPRPITSIGVSRNQGSYVALVAQDFDFATFTGLLRTQPMPSWLDPTDWHSIRVTITQTSALIEVAQGTHPFTPVLQVTLLHPIEPLGFEFSVDNEIAPGVIVPVTIPDGLDVASLDIRLVHVH